ncbi:hypothetical protein SDRG_15541 [Saprolegnia diclina VS20]|uniref:Roadblock/LAMTOR2 domain-containing protein n=1 Tax=Saprolegnia diclina (strain VS20) TaxID=1156394 RepID=T0PWJ5_SAPDV|nr:hypothetical protein SDRG_15541 [Saprolegnia diclina VS20]EQC26601.1 hypothetical protein SDRG_15541 [Saprolegnia diclina VS20]|eukprot:XP_008619939.1 hypothetical protein SDRG_15541 [Saprolegnia diclina VS20]
MSEAGVEEKLRVLLERYESLTAILVSTSEGVPLLRVEPEGEAEHPLEDAETVLPSVFAAAAEQAGKLQFGAMKSVTCFFDDTVLIHLNHLPLVTTLIAQDTATVGAFLDLADDLQVLLTPLKKAVEASEGH